MSVPLVTVLMTAYNREAWIGDAIRSVLAQTFTDFELVVVDDASTDGTAAVARAWAAADPRVRVVANERNLGQFPNRNRAAALVQGPYFKYHDSDDVMYPHCLETMLRPLMAAPAAGFALTSARGWSGGPCPMLLTPRLCYEREFLGNGMFFGGPTCALFRTDVFRELGGFPDRGVGSDHLFWLHACARTNVLLVPGDLFWYRVHQDQEMSKPAAAREYAALSADVWQALRTDGCPLAAPEREQARRNWAFNVVRTAGRHLRRGRVRVACMQVVLSGLSVSDWLRYLRLPRRDPLAGTPPPVEVPPVASAAGPETEQPVSPG
ncbi:MAG: glycosyltransferase family 2 protein [Acidobacteriota bacterium]|nr:glycosyltransferase family 2 protein [Acidobacteriota bacterium]